MAGKSTKTKNEEPVNKKEVEKKPTKSSPPSKDSGKSAGKGKDAGKKTEKASGESRPNKFANVDKGDCPNKATAYAGLTFNVKSTQKWIIEHCMRYTRGKETKHKDPTDNDKKSEDTKIKILNAHFALTAADQFLCLYLLTLANQKAKKADAGLYTVTEEILENIIKLSHDLNNAFGRFMQGGGFNQDENYSIQLNLSKKDIQNFIEKHVNGGNSNMTIDDGGFNLLAFLVLKNRIMLTDAAYHMITYAKKSSIDDRAILASVRIIHTKQLQTDMYKKIEETSAIVRKSPEEKDDGSESDEKPKKVVKGGKDTKEAAKKPVVKKGKKAQESEDEPSSESASGSDSD